MTASLVFQGMEKCIIPLRSVCEVGGAMLEWERSKERKKEREKERKKERKTSSTLPYPIPSYSFEV
jgi:hypothetical protein